MRLVYTIPIGGFLIGLALIGGFQGLDNNSPNPDNIDLYTDFDYELKSEAYANRGDRQEAIETCESMKSKGYTESQTERCLLGVYKALDETDNIITIYEKQLTDERAAGNSGDLTEHVLNTYREKRDKNK